MAGLTTSVFHQALISGDHADFCIRSHGYAFKVYKLILCSKSPWFKAVTSQAFKEQTDGYVDLQDEDPATIARVLMYLYSGEYTIWISLHHFQVQNYPCEPGSSSGGNSILPLGTPSMLLSEDSADLFSKLEAHALVYKAADVFDVAGLKTHAYNKFVSDFEETVLNAPKFADLAALVYESTSAHDSGLRAYFTSSCIDSYKTVSKVPGFAAVIQRHEPLCWYLGKKLETEINAAEATSESQQATITALQSRLEFCRNQRHHQQLSLSQELKGTQPLLKQAQYNLKTVMNQEKAKAGALKDSTVAKFCPHCGKSDLIIVKSVSQPSATQSEKLETKCFSCAKSWTLMAD